MIDVLAMPGTGYPNGGDSVTESFLEHLDKKRFRTSIVSYPASGFGLAASYGDSRDAGITALRKRMNTSDRFVLAGYSQGAVVAGDLAARLSPEDARRCAGVALIADGRRPAGKHSSTPGQPLCPGHGIVDERPIPAGRFPVFWASAPGDPICALPAGNPLRTVADMIEWFAVRSPEEVVRWGAKTLDKVTARQLQHWWMIDRWQDWGGAAAFARGFVFDGRHTVDYVRFGHTRSLADAVNRHVTK